MAFLTETSTWETGIYQFETTDPVQGGAGGIDNVPPNQLANRTKKIYDTLAAAGIFINPAEQAFVGQPVIIDATFEGTVSDEDLVYWNTVNTQFEKAIADGSEKQNVVGMADVTNSRVVAGGLLQTTRSDNKGDILYLSDTVAGTITTTSTGIAIGRFEYDGVITLTPAASASAASASIPPGSVTPAMLQESYYTETEIDAKCGNWDTAYSERHQWDGGATNLVAATGRTSLGLTGDVSTHCHDGMYYTETEIDAKCVNWDTAYTQTRQWDGGASGLVAATGRTSLGLTGDVSTHCHATMYYTKTEIDACCANWDSAYSERRQWDGGATNLNASNARTNLGLTGDVSTHNHNSTYYTETEINTKCGNWDSAYSERRQWDGGATNLNASTGRSSLGLTGEVSTHCHDTMYYTQASAEATFGRLATTNAWIALNSFTRSTTFSPAACIRNTYASASSKALCVTTNEGLALSACLISSTSGSGAIYGGANTGYAVGGNTAYCNLSSKYLKFASDVCITECLKANPLKVQRYYWEDSNYGGFNEFIGPMAEDFDNTFNINHNRSVDGYDGLFTVDGVALGLAIENMKEIDRLKQAVVKLHSRIKELSE